MKGIKTTKKLNLSLNENDEKQLNFLCDYFKKTPTPTIRVCVDFVYQKLNSKNSQFLKVSDGSVWEIKEE